jgi:hypothetical protein
MARRVHRAVLLDRIHPQSFDEAVRVLRYCDKLAGVVPESGEYDEGEAQ